MLRHPGSGPRALFLVRKPCATCSARGRDVSLGALPRGGIAPAVSAGTGHWYDAPRSHKAPVGAALRCESGRREP